ncbi:MAG TPA: hypothetical protein VGH82_17260 [Gaiellaceae bacterium]|jgi:hypothetical protein
MTDQPLQVDLHHPDAKRLAIDALAATVGEAFRGETTALNLAATEVIVPATVEIVNRLERSLEGRGVGLTTQERDALTRAIVEAMSGFTDVGASLLSSLSKAKDEPPHVLLQRIDAFLDHLRQEEIRHAQQQHEQEGE